MGQARARGTYEERKAEAIAAGRIKKKTAPVKKRANDDAALLAAIGGLFQKRFGITKHRR